MTHRCLFIGAALLAVTPGTVPAQDLVLEVGRMLAAQDWTTYRIGLTRPIAGPLGYEVYGVRSSAVGSAEHLWGPGLELSLFRGGRAGPYVAGGVSGGLATGDRGSLWGSWSAGLGYELMPFNPVTLGLEARYRSLELGGTTGGAEIAIRLGISLGGYGSPPPTAPGGAPAGPDYSDIDSSGMAERIEDSGVPESRAGMIAGVLSTATEVMGTPYKWGGESAEEGFDCSGLIQYAYAAHGFNLPRRSVDQARQGEKVEKEVGSLQPGDILAFSNAGGPVTHVGLYLGDSRFIHSASDGVQISRLSPDDVYGRWWYRRWVGARRIVTD